MNKRARIFLIVGLYISAVAQAADEPLDVLKEILEKKIKNVESLVDDTDVIQAINSENAKHRDITPARIIDLDKQWIEAKDGDDFTRTFIKSFMTNACAEHLRSFQEQNPVFKEIFVTDASGLNVCQTNKTSDYYQADEEWWTKAFGSGAGNAYSGKIEYDESAHSQSIPVYVPVKDPQTGRIAGVCKAVLDLSSLRDDL